MSVNDNDDGNTNTVMHCHLFARQATPWRFAQRFAQRFLSTLSHSDKNYLLATL